ncbi:MAG: hypothetical protein LAO03_10820 [Acidobacteriia bacterium]|nr:hypothetical protein [Terriglobia bacterium]
MVRLLLSACSLVLACTILSPAQDQSQPTGPPKNIEAQKAPVKVPTVPVLADGTPVFLKLLDTVNAQEAKVGDPVKFMVTTNVRYRDLVVIPRETIVMGRVTKVQPARRMIEATSKPVTDKDYWNSPSKCTPLPAEPVSQGK